MKTIFGFSLREWQLVKDVVRSILAERAGRPDDFLITYTELVDDLKRELQRTAGPGNLLRKVDEILTPESNALASMLGEISLESTSAAPDRGMLSVIVVHKTGDQRPGKGFFDLAVELGRLPKGSSEDARVSFWVAELDRVRQSYRP
jgi:hypothetical protein